MREPYLSSNSASFHSFVLNKRMVIIAIGKLMIIATIIMAHQLLNVTITKSPLQSASFKLISEKRNRSIKPSMVKRIEPLKYRYFDALSLAMSALFQNYDNIKRITWIMMNDRWPNRT